MSNNTDWLDLIEEKSKAIPEDVDWISAIQALAQELETATNLTEPQQALLVGIGAMMHRQGFREFQAGTQTAMLFNKLKN